jgi:hypothetical protein
MSKIKVNRNIIYHNYGIINTKSYLISNFRRVVYLVFILLGDIPPSEFYVPTFRNTEESFLFKRPM